MSVVTWETFAAGVDSTPPDRATIEGVVKFFVDAGVSSPSGVVGLTEEDFDWSKVTLLMHRAFARRTFRAAVAAVLVPGPLVSAPAATAGSLVAPRLMDDILEVCGPNASALAVSQVLAHAGSKLVVPKQKQNI